MPAPRFKSGSFKKISKRGPGNKTLTHHRRSKVSKAKCGACGALLNGVPRGRKIEIAKLSKTEKRPERPYGGFLCPKCLKRLMIEKARNL
ncbi:Ribosomal protein L34e [Methanococcus aeolicus Nankai-3]|jgi:large subunit ribosomal protein L34e|uniref:Large ribosomal subunit protein eL34 n=1 Tax=Methanococcus aeolicus (strain ATCC BAA-1280 / DSM 17508 / OCM 812 / Nankai-3) TaxID=419665 RepID=RL34_META3|nr:50S ribosomal protein L34e [Methanococcus aeolicus]A6UW33.1 RecName: Full=Large ribosomal subunit protein eL34; AltName: Full=50S ribosomal protein L34e [Methanococcus aeolicus Nankai-3]ABR56705.1 Ribosomal protein L34e [Methanococcus aeolicus Nankai-3]